jgi:MoaA/NifB/PqqE/SkfB family radical SAM enzyme
MVFLLEECNFSCAHCSREDGLMYSGYKLSFEQMKLCLSDCQDLQSLQRIHFTGGEPTLWTDGNLDFVDILVEVSKAGFEPSFITNGSHFTDYSKCHNFFERYFNASNKPLHVFISIDTFHRNFDVEASRSQSLDNVIKYKRDILSERGEFLNITVTVVVSKDFNSLLKDEMIEHYESLGIAFGFTPLLPRGKAKSFSHLCPNLQSGKSEDLGAYHRFYQKENWEKQNVTSRMALFDNDYYFGKRQVARLGNLPETIIQAFK